MTTGHLTVLQAERRLQLLPTFQPELFTGARPRRVASLRNPVTVRSRGGPAWEEEQPGRWVARASSHPGAFW